MTAVSTGKNGAIAFFLFFLASILASCGKPPTPSHGVLPGRAYTLEQAQAFFLVPEGLAPSKADNPAVTPSPSPLAECVAALASDGTSVLIAVNRRGFAFVRPTQDGSAYIVSAAAPSKVFQGRSVGGLYSKNGQLVCHLYRSLAFEPATNSVNAALSSAKPEKTRPLSAIAVPGPFGYAIELQPFGAAASPTTQIFALFPSSRGYFAEMHSYEGERTIANYYLFADDGGERKLTKADFERALAPRPLSAASLALRRAIETVAPGSGALALSRENGVDAYWISGSLSDSDLSFVRCAASDGRAWALSAEGRLVRSDSAGETRSLDLAAPVPGAEFVQLAVAKNFIVVAWEERFFPDTGRSGIIVVPIF